MKRKIGSFVIVVFAISMLMPVCAANDTPAAILKRGGYSVQLELRITKKKPNALQRVASFFDYGPNAFATGFLVGDGLIMTAYHAVSGELDNSKRAMLRFSTNDKLEVRATVNGCEAEVVMVDTAADLALLRVCDSQKRDNTPAFQTTPAKNEKLLLIARPHGSKLVRKGVYIGTYMFQGLEFLSAKLDWHNGFSGSPVYNDKAELVGVFSSYDGSKNLALISPATRVRKLLEDYNAKQKP